MVGGPGGADGRYQKALVNKQRSQANRNLRQCHLLVICALILEFPISSPTCAYLYVPQGELHIVGGLLSFPCSSALPVSCNKHQ